MQLLTIQRIVALLLGLFAFAMLPPAMVALALSEPTLPVFLLTFAGILVLAFFIWLPVRHHEADLRLRDGFLVVVAGWVVVALAGAVPFLFTPGLATVDALFESVSGLTTTGASVLTGLDALPASTLLYRQLLQWIGGMGVIVLGVAVLPMLGIGGMQVFRRNTPGPMKYNRLTARMVETARGLSYVYLALTVACGLAYWVAGMGAFDAVAHALSTVALGGFSPHDANLGHFGSAAIEAVATVFILASGVNFALHFLAWRGASLQPYRESIEIRTYATLLAVVAGIAVVYLFAGTGAAPAEALRHGIFHAVSMATTAGFTAVEHHLWPAFLPVLLLFASFIGGCAGSTGGGLKVIRVLLLMRQGGRELRRLIHPNAFFAVRLGDAVPGPDVIDSVWGFFSLYVITFCAVTIVLVSSGLDLVTAFSAVAACINNLGPGLGEVSGSYAGLGDSAKWLLCLTMLIGRLEIFTLLLLLMPGFWRK